MADVKEIRVKAIVKSVISTTKEGLPLMKTRGDGSTARYDLCSIELQEGPLVGQQVWAQRTLVNKDGVEKKAVEVDQEIDGLLTVNNGKPFWEISTGGAIASDADVLSAYASMLGAVAPAEDVALNAGSKF